MATTFAGILSRKAGKTMNVNPQSATTAQVSDNELHQALAQAMGDKLVIGGIPKDGKKVAPQPQASEAPAPAPQAEKPKRAAKPKATKTKAAPAPKADRPKLTMVQYSAKCLALFGDTKLIKDQLKKLGGRYNPNLHPFGESTSVPGWVFPMKCKADLQKLVG